jgi:hypothetical protein
MSIGLVIENIAGSVRESPPAVVETGLVDKSSQGTAASTPGNPPNPSEPLSGQAQLTPGFSVVVLQLLNEQGAVVTTIPSAQQLAAYRNGTAAPPS